jgi:hypothetical protein
MMLLSHIYPIQFQKRTQNLKKPDVEWLTSHPPLSGSIPPELWFKIVSMLTMTDLPAVALTCGSLRWIAQSFMFTKISFRPPARRNSLIPYLERISTRILFLASPHVINSVVECWVASGKGPNYDGINRNLAFDAIFDAMNVFPSLRHIYLCSVTLTQKHLSILRSLRVCRLELKSCSIRDNQPTLGPVPVTSFICNDSDDCGDRWRGIGKISTWLDPVKIQHITIGSVYANSLIATLAQSPISFNSLVSLTIPVDIMTSVDSIAGFANCPNLQHLRLKHTSKFPEYFPDTLPPFILPNLTSFDGPHQYCFLFSQNCALHSATLRPLDNFPTTSNSTSLCRTLTRLGPHLDYLDILAEPEFTPYLSVLRSYCPRLRSFAINAHPEFYARCPIPADIIKVINTHGLPEGLRHIAFGVQMRGNKARIMQDVLSIFDVARGACETLEELRMWYWACPRPVWVSCRRFPGDSPNIQIEERAVGEGPEGADYIFERISSY